MFQWGWTPFVDPDPMLSYFTCDQLSHRPRRPDQLLQRRELVRRRSTTGCTRSRTSSSTGTKRVEIVHQMLRTHVRLGDLQRTRPEPGPAGLPHRPLRGLAAPAGGHRPRDLLEHVADLREPDADRRRRRRTAAALGRRRRSSRSRIAGAALIALDRRRASAAPAHARRSASSAAGRAPERAA